MAEVETEFLLGGYIWEDLGTFFLVKVEDFCGSQSESQTQRDDSTGRCAGYQIEMIGDNTARLLFHSANTAAVNAPLIPPPSRLNIRNLPESVGIERHFSHGTPPREYAKVRIATDGRNSKQLLRQTGIHSPEISLRIPSPQVKPASEKQFRRASTIR